MPGRGASAVTAYVWLASGHCMEEVALSCMNGKHAHVYNTPIRMFNIIYIPHWSPRPE